MKNHEKFSPLIQAAYDGNLAEVKRLIAENWNVYLQNADGDTALIVAVDKRHVEIVEFLLQTTKACFNIANNIGMTALMRATIREYAEIVRMLINADVDVNLIDIGGRSALMFAAKHRKDEIAKMLLEAGADVNVINNNGETVLDVATPEVSHLLKKQ